MAEARAVSPAYPYGNQAIFRAERVEVEPNQLLTVNLKRNNRTFVIPEEDFGSEIGVCGCHGPFGVGGLVDFPHKHGYPACMHCSESVKTVLKNVI